MVALWIKLESAVTGGQNGQIRQRHVLRRRTFPGEQLSVETPKMGLSTFFV